MLNANRKSRGILGFVISGLIVLAAVWIIINRQFALDVFTNWTYQPDSSIASIVDRTELTEKGKFMFFATRPEVLDQGQFNSACPRQEAGSPILGCYTAADRIYMYNVTDEQLDGMKEVTAAHEILHAVWQRADENERDRLGVLLQKAYEDIDDDMLKTRMEYYERTEPGQLTNELHSILGTERANLGDELESYYNQFFSRTEVLTLHDNYSKLYLDLSSRYTELSTQMTEIGKNIESASAAYELARNSYSNDFEAFNQKARSGGFTTTAQFNAERSALVSRSNQLESDRLAINAQVATYNTYQVEYTAIGEQLQALNEGMDSHHTIEQVPPM